MSSSHERATSDVFVASPFLLSSATDTSSDAPTLALPNERLARVVRAFQAAFPTAKADAVRVAVAPGRVNLIGEHIDYEGYSVLPMAIGQSMAVAISTASPPSTAGGITMRIANTDPAYPAVSISLASQGDATGDTLFQSLTALLDASTAWARYVLCGYMAAIEWSPALARQSFSADVVVDGTIPPACGLSSSSALVVASALALTSALCADGDLPTRTQLADTCRYAEQYVGTAGGGMDQAVSCLAAKNAALFVSFEPALQVEPVAFPPAFQRGEAVFLVVNSGVQAHKAEDAAERFNKRVVECALATKLLGKRLNVVGWEKMTTLRELHRALERDRGQTMLFEDLLSLVGPIRADSCFEQDEIEQELSPLAPLHSLFKGSRLEKAAQQVLPTGARVQKLRLWQRVRHVWREAERVQQFRTLLTEDDSPEQLQSLGALMLASHMSCRDDYECSCPELDLIVDTAQQAGAYGARLTGAGWGGCAVVLAAADRVASLRRALEDVALGGRGPLTTIFESSASDGVHLFQITN